MSDVSRRRICLILIAAGSAVMICFSVLFTHHDVPSCVSGRGESAYDRIEPIKISADGAVGINTVDPDSLISLHGIGKNIAGLIAEEFAANGPYFYPEDLMAVKGIGKKKLQTILPDINLSVSEEERIR